MNPIDLANVINAIGAGLLDDDLTKIENAVDNRKRVLDLKVVTQVGASLHIGQTVKFNGRTTPRYMIGVTATVEKINHTTAKVRIADEHRGRFTANTLIKAPLVILDPV